MWDGLRTTRLALVKIDSLVEVVVVVGACLVVGTVVCGCLISVGSVVHLVACCHMCCSRQVSCGDLFCLNTLPSSVWTL